MPGRDRTGRLLPAKDKSIAATRFQGSGREAEYRIQGIPGLVLVVQQLRGGTADLSYLAGLLLPHRRQHPHYPQGTPGALPTIGLAEAVARLPS